MMLEQVELLSAGDYKQSTKLQPSPDCVDRAAELNRVCLNP